MTHLSVKLTTLVTVGAALSFSVVQKADALTFNLSYDSSMNGYAYLTELQTANNYVANELSSLYNNPVTLNITIKADTDPNGLGASLFENTLGTIYSYGQVKSALQAKTSTAASISAINSLPAPDPTNGGNFYFTNAHAKAVGLLAANNSASDGSVFFGLSTPFTFDPLNRAVVGKQDYLSVAEHEFTEIMGRITQDYAYGYTAFDLFRFTAPNTRNLSKTATNVYFSTDNGVTNLRFFNSTAGGDLQDWASGYPPTSAFDAFGAAGDASPMRSFDNVVMNTLGWQAPTAVPFDFDPTFGVGVIGAAWWLKKALKKKS